MSGMRLERRGTKKLSVWKCGMGSLRIKGILEVLSNVMNDSSYTCRYRRGLL